MKLSVYLSKVIHFFNMEAELEDSNAVYEEIKKGIIFKGTNLWILIFAILLASVGLNMNSTAVIIGAMLISPLMGPINGMGYSIATYDLDLFKRSIKNFSFAILTSLVTSTLYFAISPVSTAHSEILARTSPTIYDVLIALFGGLAGIVALSSKQKGNVIPGVAIATALMPPLCTAGYGLATGQYVFFFGALYLFTINTIFIAIASVLISQILQFPIRGSISENRKRKINRLISSVILIVLLPSIYFGYQLVLQENFIQKSNMYVSNISMYEGRFLLKHEVYPKSRKIILLFGGTALTDEQKASLAKKLKDFKLDNAQIEIEQGLTFSGLDNEEIQLYKLKEQINELGIVLNNRELKLDSINKKNAFGNVILQEIKSIYPQIQGCIYSESNMYNDTLKKPQKIPIVILTIKNEIGEADKNKITNWLRKRLNTNKIKIIYEE